MKTIKDALGQRGESIFFVRVTEQHPGRGPIFKPQFLGDKWPLIDFIVELEDCPVKTFCFVQVKATREGYTKKGNRLKVRVSEEDVKALAAYPVPTYLVGIDEVEEKGYIISANGEKLGSLSSLNTNFPLNLTNCDVQWNEMSAYWKNIPSIPKLTSTFSDPDWR